MTAALATGPPDGAIKALTAAGTDLVTADRAYQLFVDSLPPAVRQQSTMPVSLWVTDSQLWQQPDVAGFITTLRSGAALAPVHDLSLLFVATDPAPVGTDGQISLLPATSAITVRLVVADVGNEAERHVTVTAELGGAPGRGPETVRHVVDLSTGQRLASTLGTLHPQAGTVYALTVNKRKLKDADPAGRSTCKQSAADGARTLTCTNTTMAQFAPRLRDSAFLVETRGGLFQLRVDPADRSFLRASCRSIFM